MPGDVAIEKPDLGFWVGVVETKVKGDPRRPACGPEIGCGLVEIDPETSIIRSHRYKSVFKSGPE